MEGAGTTRIVPGSAQPRVFVRNDKWRCESGICGIGVCARTWPQCHRWAGASGAVAALSPTAMAHPGARGSSPTGADPATGDRSTFVQPHRDPRSPIPRAKSKRVTACNPSAQGRDPPCVRGTRETEGEASAQPERLEDVLGIDPRIGLLGIGREAVEHEALLRDDHADEQEHGSDES